MGIFTKISKARMAVLMSLAMIVTSLAGVPAMSAQAATLEPGTTSVFPDNFTVSAKTVGKWEGTELTLTQADGTDSANQLATGKKGYLSNSDGDRLYVDATAGAFKKMTDQGGYFQFSVGTCVYVPVQLGDNVIVKNWQYTDRTNANSTRLTYEIGHNSTAVTNSGEHAIYTYKADETDATNGYVLIKATNAKYIKSIEVVPTKWAFKSTAKGFFDNTFQKDTGVAGNYNGLEVVGKLWARQPGNDDFQFNGGTIKVPVVADDVVTVVSYPGYHNYTVGGVAADADSYSHAATATEVEAGYVEVVATGSAYLYSISVDPPSGVAFTATVSENDLDKITEAVVIEGDAEPVAIGDVTEVAKGANVTISANVIDGYEMFYKVGDKAEQAATKGATAAGKTVYTADLGTIAAATEVKLSTKSLSRTYKLTVNGDDGVETIKVDDAVYTGAADITVHHDAVVEIVPKVGYAVDTVKIDGVKATATDNKVTVENVTKDTVVAVTTGLEGDVIDYGDCIDEEQYIFEYQSAESYAAITGLTLPSSYSSNGQHGLQGAASMTFKLVEGKKANIEIYECVYGAYYKDNSKVPTVNSGELECEVKTVGDYIKGSRNASEKIGVFNINGAEGDTTITFAGTEYIHGFKVSYLSDNVNVTVTNNATDTISNIKTQVGDADATAYTDKITVASGADVKITFDVAEGNEAFYQIGDADKVKVTVAEGKGTIELKGVQFATTVKLTTESLDRTYDVTIAKDDKVAEVTAKVGDDAATITDDKFAAKANSKVTITAKPAAGYEVFAKIDEHTVPVTKAEDGSSVITIDSVEAAAAVKLFSEEVATEEGYTKTRWDFCSLNKEDIKYEGTTAKMPNDATMKSLVVTLLSDIEGGASNPKVATGGYSDTDGKELGAQFRKASIKIPVVGSGKVYVITEGTKCELDGTKATATKMVASYEKQAKGSFIELANKTVAPEGGSYKDEDDYVLYIYKIENAKDVPSDGENEPDVDFDIANYANGETTYTFTDSANYAGGTAEAITTDIAPGQTFYGGALIAGDNSGSNKLTFGSTSDGLRYRAGRSILFPLKDDTTAVRVTGIFNGDKADRRLWAGKVGSLSKVTMSSAGDTITIYDTGYCTVTQDGKKYLNLISDGDCKVKSIKIEEFNPINDVTVSGKITGANAGKLVFTDISTVDPTAPEATPYIGELYETEIKADGTYSLELKRVCAKTKFAVIIASDEVEILDEEMYQYVSGNDAAVTINFASREMQKAVCSGKLAGVDRTFVKDGGFKLTLKPTLPGFPDKEITLKPEADGSYSFGGLVLKSGETYTPVLEGLDDYEITSGTISKTVGTYDDVVIEVALKKLIPLTGKMVTSDGSVAAPKAITFKNMKNGYTYTFNMTGDEYEAELCPGEYETTVTVDGYETYDHVSVKLEDTAINNDVYLKAPVDTSEVPYSAELFVGEGQQFTKIQDAVDYIARMERTDENTGDPMRVTIKLTDALYRQQVAITIPYVSLESVRPEGSKLTWYYGMGYSYYSAGHERNSSCLLYDEARAVDKYGYVRAVDNGDGHYGACLNTFAGAKGFTAYNIVFENSFNRYQTEEEVIDGVGKGAENAKIDRSKPLTSAALKASNAKERASAVYNLATEVEFKNCTFISNQDTLFTGNGNENVYYANCFIEGNTDFIWGDGNNIFDNCILSVTGYSDQPTTQGYLVANKKVATNGYLFYNCKVQKIADPEIGAISKIAFARAWAAGKCAFINTEVVQTEDFSISTDARYADMNEKAKDATYKEYNTHYSDGTPVPLTCATAGLYDPAKIVIDDPTGYAPKDFMGAWKPIYYGPFDVKVAKDANVTNVKYSLNGAAAVDMPEKLTIGGADSVVITYTVADGYTAFAEVKDEAGNATGIDAADNKITLVGTTKPVTIDITTKSTADLVDVTVDAAEGVKNVAYSVNGADYKTYAAAVKVAKGMKVAVKAEVADGYVLTATVADKEVEVVDSTVTLTVDAATALKLTATKCKTINVTYPKQITNVVAEINGAKVNLPSSVSVNVVPNAKVVIKYEVKDLFTAEVTAKDGGAAIKTGTNEITIDKLDADTAIDIKAVAEKFNVTIKADKDITNIKYSTDGSAAAALPKNGTVSANAASKITLTYDIPVGAKVMGSATGAVVNVTNAKTDITNITSNAKVTLTLSSSAAGDEDGRPTTTIPAVSENKVVEQNATNEYGEKTTFEFTFAGLKDEYEYLGGAVITPAFDLYYSDGTYTYLLDKNVDYTVAYKNNKKLGDTATITVKGKGAFAGTATTTFKIVSAFDTKGTTSIKKAAKVEVVKKADYTGAAIKPVVKVTDKSTKATLTEGEDYEVIYSNNVNAGKASVAVYGIGKYNDVATAAFTINPIKIDDGNAAKYVSFNGIENAVALNNKKGTAAKTEVIDALSGKTLAANGEYTLKCANNKVKTKNATAVFTFKGNFKGKVTKTYEVEAGDIDNLTVVAGDLAVGDKIVNAKNYVAVDVMGTALKAEFVATDDIDKVAVKAATDLAVAIRVDGTVIDPKKDAKMLAAKDKSVTYVFMGVNNYSGTIEADVDVISDDYIGTITKATLKDDKKYAYTGKAITPDAACKKGAKYTLTASLKKADKSVLDLVGATARENNDIDSAEYMEVKVVNNYNTGSAFVIAKGTNGVSGVKTYKMKIAAKKWN